MKKIIVLVILFVQLDFQLKAQQLLTLTVTSTNRNCGNVCSVMDTSIFHNKTAAIILATPMLVNGTNLNPHPVAAYYMYLNSWSIFNLDGTNIGVGAKYNVEYWLTPDPDHFVYVVPQRINANDKSYVDNPGLNNNPNAQIRVFPRLTYVGGPGNTQNPNDVKMTYDVTVFKWYISNVNNTPIPIASAYSIVIGNGAGTTNPNGNNTGGNCNCVLPTTLPPNGLASGDLVGTYPDPMVRKIMGRFLSNAVPAIGQVLKWNGTEWIPSADEIGSTSNTQTGAINGRNFSNAAPIVGQVLKWNGSAWEPADANVGNNQGPVSKIKTYYKYTNNMQGSMEVPGVLTETKIPSISGLVITVTEPSTLVISATCYARGNCPLVGSCPLNIEFYYKVNNNPSYIFPYSGAEYLTAVISNHFYDVAPGTYTIDFFSRQRQLFSQLTYSAAGGYATVMVLPK